MRNYVKRAVLLGVTMAAAQMGLVAPHQSYAQDREFPVLNTLGRYLGVGYTRDGYHAAYDGRMDIVSDRHPASDYRLGGLPHRATPFVSGTPFVHSWQQAPVVTSPSSSGASTKTNINNTGKPAADEKSSTREPASTKASTPEVIETPRPVDPPKPSGPPPSWLKDYLKDESEKSSSGPKDNIETKAIELESSPSDLLLPGDEDSLLPAKGVTYTIIEPGSPSFEPSSIVPLQAPVGNRYHSPLLPR